MSNRWLLALGVLFAGCATSMDLGLLQHAPGDGTGGSLTGHMGFGGGVDKLVAVQLDLRGDVAESGSRFAVGGSVLGGLPIVDRYRVLARAGVWHSAYTSTTDRSLVPTFEVAGFIPLNDHPTTPKHPEYGRSEAGLVIGVREDLDTAAYTTVFVGLAVFLLPGY